MLRGRFLLCYTEVTELYAAGKAAKDVIKVFLVDDEIVIREGIRNSFPWEESGYTLVGEAPDGEIALPMIRDENPDILITDICMPFMDGMQLCREVRMMMPRMGIIILSGYDDFDYARQAISLGVHEYLLKPVTSADLKDALDRVSERLREERKALESMNSIRRRLASGNRFVRERLLSTLFTDEGGEKDARQIIEQMRGLGINLMASCYVVMDIAFECGDKSGAMEVLWQFSENSGDIIHICASHHGARALILGDSEADVEERSYSLARSIVCELESIGAQNILVSIGETVNNFAELKASVKSARHIRHQVTAQGKTAVRITGVREAGDLPSGRNASGLDIRPLHERLQYASSALLDEVFAEYVMGLNSAALHSAVAMDYLRVEAMVTASRIVTDAGGNPDEVLPEGWKDLGMLPEGDIEDTAPILALLRVALAYRDENNPSRGNPSIARARFYLSRHFTNPNLMLQDVAREACMSGSRFSTVFAQETGLTFTEYLASLRLGKAKELLLATDMRSSQIALAVGYSDPHYFSYLFKKSTGMTPSDFRRQGKRD